MSIQIVDNFQVNAGLPIDTRMVASGSVARNAIQYKYEGLRVFDLSDGVPYAWRNGAWVSENSLSLFGFGTADYIPKYKVMGGPSGSNVLENTIIVEKQFGSVKRIGIDTDNFTFFTTGSSATPIPAKLAVEGIIGTRGTYPSGGFFGDGAHISNINASNILSGTLNLQRLQITGSPDFILARNSSQAVWTDPNNITVNRSNFAKLTLDTTASLRYFVFYDGTTIATSDYKSLLTNTSRPLSIHPSSGIIGINVTSAPPTTDTSSVNGVKLHINGQIRISQGSPGSKKLLMCDDNDGRAIWKSQAEVSVPVGTIVMWGGAAGNIPTNWILCNGGVPASNSLLYTQLVNQLYPFGQVTTGLNPGPRVPDLRNRFIVGAGSAYSVNATGGFNEITLTKAQIPKHTHKLDNGVDGAVMSNPGNHTHSYQYADEFGSNPGLEDNRGSNSTQQTGGAGGHTHTGNTGDGTTDGLNGQPHENRPPYFALCYIIKIN